ncbi:MAG: 16S rRNA (cytosine(1402)-N(4))-methyltransferase RsmH [Nitrospirae bacterium]|nr:16S rRNA (cytosine(1402)-N(4))-methyltransferase RsmH [Nitrospirota bacterium]
MGIVHVPVMLKEVVEMLMPVEGGVYVDGTVGLGGHAESVLKAVKGCTLIGIDRDEKALGIAQEKLKNYNVHLIRDRFSNMKIAVENIGYKKVDGILLDLGVSTLQFKAEGRGFSFLKDELLNMRMDEREKFTAEDIVNEYSEERISHILWEYGEERFSRKIAKAIVNARNKRPITSCMELAKIIERALPRRGRIHPATKTFQALRIEVNRELVELNAAIDAGVSILRAGGRFCIISYHSLEDRVVKHSFKRLASHGVFDIITKKPIAPCREEVLSNPSSRSAKLRVGEKI